MRLTSLSVYLIIHRVWSLSVCKGVTEVPGRFLVHSGDLIEIDAESLSVVQKVSLFLLSDSLMIALLMPHR